MIGVIIFGGAILVLAGVFGIVVDNGNQNAHYCSSIPVFVTMLLFSMIVGGAVSMKVHDDEYLKGYKQGQVDYQNGKIEYRMEIKQKNDSIISKIKS